MDSPTKIVFKNDGSVPASDILCTTYQMRNFYKQFNDGYFSDLDVMNYIQHFKAVKMTKKGDSVLDVCCGRGLLLPLLRYHSPNISQYIGVDIKESNIESSHKNICNGREIDPKEYYPFSTKWIISNVDRMSDHIPANSIDFIVYTSAIEHMHKDTGYQSLIECHSVAKPGATLFLSCPNTPEDQDGYSVRYKAHVYEWKLSELSSALSEIGFTIHRKIGLTGEMKTIKSMVQSMGIGDQRSMWESTMDYLPNEFLKPLFFIQYPEEASEVLLLCSKNDKRRLF